MRDLIFEVVDGVATISINRPHARNALAHQTMTELDEAIELARNESRVLIIRGEGDRAFCAGGDLKELEHMRSAEEAASMAHRMRATLDTIFTAKEALQAGVIEEVVPTSEFDVRVAQLARVIASAPSGAVAGIKHSVNAVHPHRHPDLGDAAIEEFASTWADPAHWEAVARLERRRREER